MGWPLPGSAIPPVELANLLYLQAFPARLRFRPERRGAGGRDATKAPRHVPDGGTAIGWWCGLNSRPFSTTSTTASEASVQRKNPVANGSSVPS